MQVARQRSMLVWLAAPLALGLACSVAHAEHDPWSAGSNWMYLRGGYSKSTANGEGNGGAGYGFGFRHLLKPSRVKDWRVLGIRPLGFLPWTLFKNWSFGGSVGYDVLGRFGEAADIEVPVAVDLTRHIMWRSAGRPYVSLGTGPFYRKTYQTGNDLRVVNFGGYVASGFDVPVGPSQMLGFDFRIAHVDGKNKPVNPVFGPGQVTATHWGLKLAYSVVY